jgi:phage FluMu protein Com
MTEVRCKKCNRLLFKGKVDDIEIKCPKCGTINRIFTSDRVKLVDGNK